MVSTYEKRVGNENQILELLSRYGYLRIRDLALGVWRPNASDQMARKTLLRLREDGYVAEKRWTDGTLFFALSIKGANRLRKLGVNAHSTAPLLNRMVNVEHRCKANEISLIYEMDPENRVYTEHQIQAGRHPIAHAFNKIPDYFVETVHGGLWGEVENSRRSTKDFNRLLRWLRLITEHQEGFLPELNGLPELYLFRIEFVCSEAFERRLLRGLADVVAVKPGEGRTVAGLVEDFVDEWLWFRRS